ncbi:hypothetical protein QJS66_06975 [Kocuria rhizophila]|nr:hypothetical protein QJS66_06975 [Kocuria rhizophila]
MDRARGDRRGRGRPAALPHGAPGVAGGDDAAGVDAVVAAAATTLLVRVSPGHREPCWT